MARPITWQDVAAPNLGSSLAASQAAGDSIRNALAGLGGVVENYQDDTRAEATKQAVAQIMTSADPMAAAKAAPQGWQVDPLAVAQAAQQTDTRLRQNAAADASLDASKVSTELNREVLEDRTNQRVAASLASPMIDEIMKTGKLPPIDLNNPEWKTSAGNLAHKEVIDFWNNYQDDKLRASDMHLRRQLALKDKAKEDALGWARSFGASPEGQQLDPAEVDRRITKEFERRGVSAAHVGTGAQFFEQGAQANRATEDELDQDVPNFGDATYFDLNSNLSLRARDLNQQKAAKVSQFDRAIRGQELAAGTVFTGPVAGIPAKLATELEWSNEDAKEAIDAVKAEYKGLTDWQAADIVLDTKGKWFEGAAARSDEAKAKAGAFKAFNEIGGNEGLAKEIDRVSSPFDRELARLPIIQRQVTGAARRGDPVPTEAVNITKSYRAAEQARKQEEAEAAQKIVDDAAAEQKALDAAEAEAQRRRGPGYTLR
jgi:hypothetical protein